MAQRRASSGRALHTVRSCSRRKPLLVLRQGSVVIVQSPSPVQLFMTPWTAAHQASLSLTVSRVFAQVHVHWISDAIQLSHPLLSLSPPTLNLSQHQGLFQWVSSSHHMVKILELQHPMSILGWFPLGLTGLISLLSKARQWPQHNRQTGYRGLISACSMWTRLSCWNWFINRDVLIPWLFLKFHEVLQPE